MEVCREEEVRSDWVVRHKPELFDIVPEARRSWRKEVGHPEPKLLIYSYNPKQIQCKLSREVRMIKYLLLESNESHLIFVTRLFLCSIENAEVLNLKK